MVEKLTYSSNQCMKLGLWKVAYHNVINTALSIYRAPYLSSNVRLLLFLNMQTDILPHHNNLVILGKIKLHLNKKMILDRCVIPESVCTWFKKTCQ